MKFDVVMCTYNSNKEWFSTVLKSIKGNIPVARLIVIDGYSTDGTLDVVKSYFPDAVVVQTTANLAYARYIGIRLVESEWFVFTDDVVILPNWFDKIRPYLNNERIGAIEGIDIAPCLVYPTFFKKCIGNSTKYSLRNLRKPIKQVSASDVVRGGLFYHARGYTTHMIIRKATVADWRPHPSMGAFEDLSITQHVVGKGYLHVVINRPLYAHLGWQYLSRTGSWLDD